MFVLVKKHLDAYCLGVHQFDDAAEGAKVVQPGIAHEIQGHEATHYCREYRQEKPHHHPKVEPRTTVPVRKGDLEDAQWFLRMLRVPAVSMAVRRLVAGEPLMDPADLIGKEYAEKAS